MKIRNLKDDAKRLNVSVETVREIFEKNIQEGKINGVLDPNKDQAIIYKSSEMASLAKRLNSRRISNKKLGSDLGIGEDQVRLVVDDLCSRKMIQGGWANDGTFVSDQTLKKLITKKVEKNARLDQHELSNQLSVPKTRIRHIINGIAEQISTAIAPYNQIKISDLAVELKLPEFFTLELLKELVTEKRISGQLDMVNRVLMIEKPPDKTKGHFISDNARKVQPIKSPPSQTWYIVPFFFGIIGGLIAYVAVKDRDSEMATDLLVYGVIITIIVSILGIIFWL